MELGDWKNEVEWAEGEALGSGKEDAEKVKSTRKRRKGKRRKRKTRGERGGGEEKMREKDSF